MNTTQFFSLLDAKKYREFILDLDLYDIFSTLVKYLKGITATSVKF